LPIIQALATGIVAGLGGQIAPLADGLQRQLPGTGHTDQYLYLITLNQAYMAATGGGLQLYQAHSDLSPAESE
jgi:hypothetical protein